MGFHSLGPEIMTTKTVEKWEIDLEFSNTLWDLN